MYVALNNQAVGPSAGNFDYQSSSTAGFESVRIGTGDAIFFTKCGAPNATAACVVYIAVVGVTSTRYQIVAYTDSSPRRLLDGEPQTGAVPYTPRTGTAYVYFFFIAEDATAPWTLTVTPLTGDPDVVVGLAPQPNISTALWRSYSDGVEVLRFNFDGSDARLPRNTPGFPLTFYVGVYGFGGPASFSIAATSMPYTTLPDGVPVTGTASPTDGLALYSFMVPPLPPGGALLDLAFEVTLIPLSGAGVSAWVAVGQFPTCVSSCSSGAMAGYSWSTASSTSLQRLLVSPGLGPFVANAPYGIAVLAYAGPASFIIHASFLSAYTTLVAGVPVTGVAPDSNYTYYRLTLTTPNVDVAVTVTPLSGDPDLVVSVHANNPRPTTGHMDKASTGGPGQSEFVSFAWNELDSACGAALAAPGGSCDVFIGVYGFDGDASYTIVASVNASASASLLEDGVPQSGAVARGEFAYYYARVAVPVNTTYSVYVRALSGA